MDRRSFVMTGAWFSAAGGVWPRLAAAPGLVIGVTRASDYFVLGELTLHSASARMVEHRSAWRTEQGTPVAFLIGPAALVDAPGPAIHVR